MVRLASSWQAFVFLALLGCNSAWAQPREDARFKEEPRPVVAPATTFIEETHGSRAYPLNASVILTRRRSKASAEIHAKGVVARLFRLGSSGQADPTPWLTIGHCDIYYTNVITVPPPAGESDNALSLGRFDDDAWLQPNVQTGHMERGRYLVIFEQAANAQRVFRLHSADRKEYFKQGYLLVLEPPPDRSYSPSVVSAIHARLEGGRRAVEDEVSANNPTLVCYFLKKVTPVRNDFEGTIVATGPCDGDPPAWMNP